MKLMLIGGGDVGRGRTSYETKEIDEEIVKMTGKENPNFLFVGLASSFSDSYYDTMKLIYKDLGCTCAYLKKKNILNNPDIVKNKISDADIIYFCGGDSVKLVNDLKEYGIDKLLYEAIKNDTVIAGMSAGAIMLANKGYSDSLIIRGESDKYEFIPGLGFLNINICPHYEGDKRDELHREIEDNTVYCLENCTALKVIDGDISVVRCYDKHAYITKKESEIIEEDITTKVISL